MPSYASGKKEAIGDSISYFLENGADTLLKVGT